MTMAGARVLITGGAGLVGSHIADLCVREGAGDIAIFDKLLRGRPENLAWAVANGPVTLVEGDLRDRAAVEHVVRGADIVFHQAALRVTQCAEEPRLALEVMVDGTFNVLEAAARAKVKKVVAASSASIYGMAAAFPTPEEHPPYANRTFYGAAKAFNEGLLRSFHEMEGLDYVALRYFNIYGPRMAIAGPHTEVLVRWIERIAGSKPPLIFGDGRQTIDFVHVEDVARANVLAACAPVTDEAVNVGTGVETSLLDLARLLLEIMGSDLAPEHLPERKVNPVPRRVADVRKAERLLGFGAEIALDEGLRGLVAWWQEQRCAMGRSAR